MDITNFLSYSIMHSLIEALLQRYLQTRSVLPIPNDRINDRNLDAFLFNQIALLWYHHEQETLHQLRLAIEGWVKEKHEKVPSYEAALRNFHELEVNTDALVKAEFI
ncbi:hypothetical protein GYMLUDRAFT_61711 [Collybiopsis luxurians FD-317 M1]|uniref:Uncharacterized protein n=1 Tax=Collybiopsis luxurians FD-317 M1 TaxID=944289 RepID=A0A0D0C3B1_9AGAR|nr:hypothetical protein GYMLUDRAFT_61711 [Collybiopsis luxurians FD-317 M1]